MTTVSPQPTSLANRLPKGAAIGALVGSIWTVCISPLADPLWQSFVIYVPGLAATGLLVAAVQRLPVLVGLNATLILSVIAAIIGPWDTWIGVWIVIFGSSGLVGGPIVGGLFYLLAGEPVTDEHSARDAAILQEELRRRM